MNSSSQSDKEVLEHFQNVPKMKLSPGTKQRIKRELRTQQQQELNTTHRFRIRWGGILAGLAGVAIVTLGYFAVSENHSHPSPQQPVTTASNSTQPQPNTTQTSKQLRASSIDKSAIKVLEQRTSFKAISPAYLPTGYRDYTAVLISGRELWLAYRGTKQYQEITVEEQPFDSHGVQKAKTTTTNADTNSGYKTVKIDGTDVTVSDTVQPYRYDFVKNGLSVVVVSDLNSSSETVKVVKSLIDGGKPWN